MDVTDVLGPDGLVSRRLPRYEERPQQLRMGTRVEEALEGGRHLLVEAGTGVGKSFAYLVPAILRADATREKVVISTHTIALQEQLLHHDLPFLSGILPQEFSVVLAKGRRNYLCRRRLAATLAEERALFSYKADVEELQRIAAWAEDTPDGTLQDLDFSPRDEVWGSVCAEVGNCPGRRCRQFKGCHLQSARRRLHNANVVIANHALLFSDLSLRQAGGNLLPDYQVLILDEAHEAEDAAADHLGIRLTSGAVRYVLNSLLNRRGKGVLEAAGAGDAPRAAVERCRAAAERFFKSVGAWAESEAPKNLRVNRPGTFPDDLAVEMDALARELEDLAEGEENEDRQVEISARAMHCAGFADEVRSFVSQDLEEHVYWVEVENGGRRVAARSAPVRVGPYLTELLFATVRSVILTSATLTIGRNRSFGFLRGRLGIEDAEEESLGSPFDFVRQARITLPRSMPDPRSGEGFEEAVADQVVKAVFRSDGRAFVLFTSYRMLDSVHELTRLEIEGRGYRVLRQGGGLPRSRLLEIFREDITSVLFGTDSFWQGVDVPGDALSHVIIAKLPFEVPDRPLVEARTREIEDRGGNSFMEYSLPRAVLKLKQGFGRLIRNREDRGEVTILDPRVTTKRYGRLFIESLPECEILRE